MKEKEAKKILKILEEIGFLSQKDEPIKLNLNLGEKLSGVNLAKFKKFEAETKSSLSEQELAEIYESIALLHKLDSNQFESVLYKLRAIRYNSKNEELRLSYLSDFNRLLVDFRGYLKRKDVRSIKKEIGRLKNYTEFKWGLDSEISTKCSQILNSLAGIENQLGNKEDNEWNNFIREWREINRKYRPDDQALDYASQIIIDQLNS